MASVDRPSGQHLPAGSSQAFWDGASFAERYPMVRDKFVEIWHATRRATDDDD